MKRKKINVMEHFHFPPGFIYLQKVKNVMDNFPSVITDN